MYLRVIPGAAPVLSRFDAPSAPGPTLSTDWQSLGQNLLAAINTNCHSRSQLPSKVHVHGGLLFQVYITERAESINKRGHKML